MYSLLRAGQMPPQPDHWNHSKLHRTATTDEQHSGKIAPESQVAPRRRHVANLFPLDLCIRILLLGASVAAVAVIATSKQTKLIQVPSIPFPIEREVKFNTTPAFVYFVAALSAAALYSIISILVALICKKYKSNTLLFNFILIDLLMLGIVAAATGAAGSIAYTGLKGNSHAGWGKVCNIFDKFCRYVGISIALSLFSSVLLVILVILSSYTLYRRSS